METSEDIFLALEKNNCIHYKSKKFLGRDGELGNELENVLGIKENNETSSDLPWIEIKSKKDEAKTKTSLFSIGRFSQGRKSKIYKDEKYGKNWKKTREEIYNKFGANYEFSTNTEKGYIVLQEDKVLIKDEYDEIVYEVTKKELEETLLLKFGKKVLYANLKDVDENSFRVKAAAIYWDLNLNKFYSLIEKNCIQICLRLGSGNSNRDHGTAFRIVGSSFLKDIYDYYEERSY